MVGDGRWGSYMRRTVTVRRPCGHYISIRAGDYVLMQQEKQKYNNLTNAAALHCAKYIFLKKMLF